MKRSQIIDAARHLVLDSGPANVLEFGHEMFENSCPRDDPRWAHREAIVAEAYKQADRVYRFFGYEPPF